MTYPVFVGAIRDAYGYGALVINIDLFYSPNLYVRPTLRPLSKAASVASLGPPRDALDVAIRLFLLGLALSRTDVERNLGLEAVESARQLGMLGECPVDPSLLVSLVQLFPLDAEALSSSPGDDHRQRRSTDNGGKASAVPGSQQWREEKGEGKKHGLTEAAGGEGRGREGEGEHAAAFGRAIDIAPPSNMVFATDWPPPGSTALTEEPVMYIGPDSIGLVQHAPRVSPCSNPRKAGVVGSAGGSRNDVSGTELGEIHKGGVILEEGGEHRMETILDLCCGSGVQGIAAAVLRGGNAFVTCVDINPRAVRFARFNALLNGLDEKRFRAVVGDLFDALASGPSENSEFASIAQTDAEKHLPAGHGAAMKSTHGVCGAAGDEQERTVLASEDNNQKPWGSDENATIADISPLPHNLNTSLYDVILANPPFVPVPPELDYARRRYDIFASGGASGEEVIERIFCEAIDHLRPGGYLAMVSELANPKIFDAKLQHWVGGRTLALSPGVGQQDSDGVPGNDERRLGRGCGYVKLDGVVEDQNTSAWTGVVFHEKAPSTARVYAQKRAGSNREVGGWQRHLAQMGIEEMAPGFVFVRRRRALSAEGHEEAQGGGVESAGAVEIQGIEKLWAPHNKAAVEETRLVLRRM